MLQCLGRTKCWRRREASFFRLRKCPMTRTSAFGRLFPAALFSILGVILSVLWRPDPALMAVGVCAAGAAVAWLLITSMEVAQGLQMAPALKTKPPAARLPQAD